LSAFGAKRLLSSIQLRLRGWALGAHCSVELAQPVHLGSVLGELAASAAALGYGEFSTSRLHPHFSFAPAFGGSSPWYVSVKRIVGRPIRVVSGWQSGGKRGLNRALS